jgi:hypothetical protein
MMPMPTWMPGEEWDALVRGDTCPVCPEMKSSQPENDEGFTIADLAISRLRLARNQYVRGYCVPSATSTCGSRTTSMSKTSVCSSTT